VAAGAAAGDAAGDATGDAAGDAAGAAADPAAAPDKSAKQESSRVLVYLIGNFINYVVITYIILAVTNLYIDSVRVINEVGVRLVVYK
jgi:hypothetical protein